MNSPATLRPDSSAEPLLRTSKLSKIYAMGELQVVALNQVDFEAKPGEFIVILGPSGSGKSTFLNLIGGRCRPHLRGY